MRAALIAVCLVAASPAFAGEANFKAGKAIPSFGKIAEVEGAAPIPKSATFKIRFDVAKKSAAKSVNRTFESAARFINMHDAAGVPLNKMDLAVVIHGAAVHDVAKKEVFGKANANPNAELVAALQKKGVKFYVCGQSAAYYDVFDDDLLPGVEMALSAMTAHALLDGEGYSLNPF